MIQTSDNIKTIDRRINKMPGWYKNILWATRKKDANKFIDQFKKNIRGNKLDLEALQQKTIDQKERMGYDKPETPLYGMGDNSDNSYINMFLLRKISEGWKAYPRWAKHHKANLELRQLFEIHEYGCTIKRGKTLIRIPPRPAAWATYRQVLTQMKRGEKSKKVKKAITEYITNGNEKLLKEISKHDTRYVE